MALTSSYRYEADNVTEVASSFSVRGRKQHLRFNAHGLLVECRELTGKGNVTAKTFITYNTQGDTLQISEFRASHWTRVAFADYVYDEHDNWVKRSLYSTRQQDGKDIRTPEATQYRTITYHK